MKSFKMTSDDFQGLILNESGIAFLGASAET